MNAELNWWETRSLRTFEDWAEAIPDATRSILACGLRGALAGLKLGAILGGICGMPFWLLGSIPGVLIGGGAGLAYGFLAGLLLGTLLGRVGGLIAGALPGVIATLVGCLQSGGERGYLLLLIPALLGGLIGWRVEERLEPDGVADETLDGLRETLWNHRHWTLPLWFRLVIGAWTLVALWSLIATAMAAYSLYVK